MKRHGSQTILNRKIINEKIGVGCQHNSIVFKLLFFYYSNPDGWSKNLLDSSIDQKFDLINLAYMENFDWFDYVMLHISV